MSKLLKHYDRIVARLCAVGSDKYVHFIAGAALAQLAMAAARSLSRPVAVCFIFGFTVTVLAGFAKELCDTLRMKPFDGADWVATTAGGLFGAALAVLIMVAV